MPKPFSDFQVRKASKDGLTAACKKCLSEYDKSRANNPKRVKARKEYAKTEQGIESANKAKKKWSKNNVIKRGAAHIVGNAVRDGKLTKTNCIVCDSSHRICGHHENYDYPLDVIWLCNLHHRQRHKEINENIELSDSFLNKYISD